MKPNEATRCFFCKKKQLILLDCRCNYKFCITHKSPEDHNCSFDYKELGKKMLIKNNPKVINSKVEDI